MRRQRPLRLLLLLLLLLLLAVVVARVAAGPFLVAGEAGGEAGCGVE